MAVRIFPSVVSSQVSVNEQLKTNHTMLVGSDQPWCTYALHLATFNPPALIMDPLLYYLLYHSTNEVQFLLPQVPMSLPAILALFTLWLLFTKIVKLLPYFWRYPMDLKFFPALIAFGYFFGLIKLYALLTLHKVCGRTSSSNSTLAALHALSAPLIGEFRRRGTVAYRHY